VVPSASRVLKRAHPGAQFIGPRTKTGLATSVDRKTIGSDRLANVTAAHARHGSKLIVASFGTATTFDIVDSEGIHRGGAIAPGWQSFAGILSARTALLPSLGAKKAARFAGRNTREALTAGIGGGYALMVSGIIAMLADEAGVKNPRVVFTGGDAAAVTALLPWKAVSDPLLTLRGIALLAQGIGREASK
jgi:type III pantothenate kinase